MYFISTMHCCGPNLDTYQCHEPDPDTFKNLVPYHKGYIMDKAILRVVSLLPSY